MKILYVPIGFMSLSLGAIGAILPILPTTPFLLVAFCCFVKSSKKLENWLVSTLIYKKYLADFHKDNSITKKGKIKITAIATVMMCVSGLIIHNIYLSVLLCVLWIVMFWCMVKVVKTRK